MVGGFEGLLNLDVNGNKAVVKTGLLRMWAVIGERKLDSFPRRFGIILEEIQNTCTCLQLALGVKGHALELTSIWISRDWYLGCSTICHKYHRYQAPDIFRKGIFHKVFSNQVPFTFCHLPPTPTLHPLIFFFLSFFGFASPPLLGVPSMAPILGIPGTCPCISAIISLKKFSLTPPPVNAGL